MTELILASTSPRRKMILEKAGVAFTAIESGYEEDMSLKIPPAKLVRMFASGKARSLAKKHSGAVILGADTVVVSPDGEIFGKPYSQQRGYEMLKALSGKTHQIFTGFSLVQYDKEADTLMEVQGFDTAFLVFRPLSDKTIWNYVNAGGRRLEAAGSYILTEIMETFVERIEGDMDSIMGLPITRLLPTLRSLGVHVA